jgi:hypothetical protein
MPFKSEKQRKWMWANIPEVARKWEQEYGGKKPKNLRPPKRRLL